MLRRSALMLSVALIAGFAATVQASPLSVRIGDYDFTFDTDFVATYDYDADQPDVLSVPSGGFEVGSYRYLGTTGPVDLLGNPPGFYPVWASAAPLAFGGDLILDMAFNASDGPYVSGGDVLDVSLTGTAGHLTITGIIGAPMPAGAPIVLLDITFTDTSLLSRDLLSVSDLIEGRGKVNILLGEDVSAEGLSGVAFMKFMTPSGVDIFPHVIGGVYDPLVDYGLSEVVGRVSGEAGEGVPEPASLVVLALGAAALLRRRSR